MITFSPVQVSDPSLTRIQSDLKTAINALAKLPITDGLLTENVALTTTFQDISHKLGRKPLGWFVVAPDADTRVWEDALANNPDPTRFIRVRGSAAANLKFWVF